MDVMAASGASAITQILSQGAHRLRTNLTALLYCLGISPALGTDVGIPVRFNLPKPSYLTLVIEDAQGQRVRNLISETRLPAGDNVVYWDGYAEGSPASGGGFVHPRAPIGQYHVRGLVHDGLHLRYEFQVYGGGNPPWLTLDGSGGWLADHSVPCDVLFLPKGTGPTRGGAPQILVASRVGEAGDTLLLMDEHGNKIVGGPKIDGWAGGNALARDFGPKRDPEFFAYTVNLSAEATPVHGLYATRRAPERSRGAPEVETFEARLIGKYSGGVREGIHEGAGIAVYNGLIATSAPWKNKIYFFDSRKRAPLCDVTLPRPKGLLFDSEGRLLVLTATQLERYSVEVSSDGKRVELTHPETLITGLEDPQRATVASDGMLLISDWGNSHQVKVFDSQYKFVRTIGNPGGPQLGLYDEHRMQYPAGVAVDSQGHLWVAEADNLPKRVSEWSSDGTLLQVKYGPTHYGGGGTLDPGNPNRLFFATFEGILEFELDWTRGTSRVKAIVARESAQGNDPMPGENWLPERPLHVGDRTYLVGGYQGGLRGNTFSAIYLLDEKTQIGRPVGYLGSDRWWPYLYTRPEILDTAPNHEHEHFMTWSDLNGDLKVQTNEFRYRVFDEQFSRSDGRMARTYGYREFVFGPGLEATGNWTIRVPAPSITSDGVPVFDLQQAHFLIPPSAAMARSEDGLCLVPAKDGWLISAAAGYRDGQQMWSYREYPDDNTLPMEAGQYIAPTRLLGPPIEPKGESGEVFVMNGEMGNFYVFTTDGLFVQTLGGDARRFPPVRLPQAQRGQLMDGLSFEQEHFHPTITQIPNGEVYLVAGFACSSLYHVEGWDSIHRRDFGTLTLNPEYANRLPEAKTESPRIKGSEEWAIPKLTAPLKTLATWKPASMVVVDERASAGVAVDDHHLYLRWQTDDPDLLANAVTDYRFLFKKGGALDLMLDSQPLTRDRRDGPATNCLRLLVSRSGIQTKAVLYRPIFPGTAKDDQTLFASPVGQVTFDSVRDVSSEVVLEQSQGVYTIQVPLSLLGWNPKVGQSFRADIGLLRGNGVQTLQRAYWSNRDTAIVSDIPSEARLRPENWGVWKVQ